jgi:hypothetical protein
MEKVEAIKFLAKQFHDTTYEKQRAIILEMVKKVFAS